MDKDVRARALRQEILANMVLSQGTRNIVSHNVRTRIMELERDFQLLKSDALFQTLYKEMTETQMLRLQEKYVASGRNTNNRYVAIAKGVFEDQFNQIDDCRRELDNIVKLLHDTAILAVMTQYCSDAGFVMWEEQDRDG